MLSHLPVFFIPYSHCGGNRCAMTRGDMRHTHGSIEVVCGSMFSGKTDELIRRLIRATIAKQKVQVFKPAIDIRYAVEKVTSHAGANYEATPVTSAAEIREKLDKDTTVVGIDEAQFLDAEVVDGTGTRLKRHTSPGSRFGYGLPRRAFRSHAFDPCKSRTRGQAPCHLHGLRRRSFAHTETGQRQAC